WAQGRPRDWGELELSPREVSQRGVWGDHPRVFGVLCPPFHALPPSPVRYGRFDPEDQRSRHCPYLDTINKSVLDFDFEKLCSISLSHINVYACLVCGKYFQAHRPPGQAGQ
uniref:UBP-type domain-containing protein n=1 Tax=Zonotrichia albicollis TaxID=44394 RepID=A0A8D2M087_ZONAL